jgi:hypothetical protein
MIPKKKEKRNLKKRKSVKKSDKKELKRIMTFDPSSETEVDMVFQDSGDESPFSG